MPALIYAGKPVVLLDDEHNHDCSFGLTFSEHCMDGVIDLVRTINPAIGASLAEGVASRIHYRIREYLQNTLVVATRRERTGTVRTICRAPGSPLGPLRRMKAAVERRDYRGFSKNYELLTRGAKRELENVANEERWGRLGECFDQTVMFRIFRNPNAEVADIILTLTLAIQKLGSKGRRPFPERDLAAAEVILQYFGFVLSDWSGPRQPSHIIGDSRRNGPVVDFLDGVEVCYGLDTPALRLIARSSGGAWARVNSIVAEKMRLSGAA
jgi:hypothetical protein